MDGRDAKAGGLGAAIASTLAFALERFLHSESVPLELHQRLFEEMLLALKQCQGGLP